VDRQLKRSAQISGLIIIGSLGLIATAFSQQKTGKAIEQFEKQIREKRSAQDSIKSELQRGRETLKKLKKEEGNYLTQLEQIDKNIDHSRNYIDHLSERIDSVDTRIIHLSDSLDSATLQLGIRQRKMEQRLRNMYKTGKIELVHILLKSDNLTDMLHRVKYFRELKEYDRRLLESIRDTKVRIDRHKTDLQQQREILIELRSNKEEERQQMVSEKSYRKSLLEEVQSEKDAYALMVEELEAAQKELDVIIRQLEKRRERAELDYRRGLEIDFASRKGSLPWPVSGNVLRTFGKIVHPVYKTVIMNNGIDIEAQRGQSVSCVAPGRVIYIGWMRGLGKFVMVDHFEGYLTIYAHLSTVGVREDQEVEYGTPVGRVGDTGSLQGAKLHFQIRKSTTSLDPLEWLEKE
jgi:septal ring factor EnvC (AmiA/AmiB activator)